MLFSFVILHYQAADVTRRCVSTVLSAFPNDDISVVVVDNCSPNGSGILLEHEFEAEHRIHFVLLDKNLGFARGNNAGYDYAVQRLNPDFIVVMNNDVFIQDKDFLDKAVSSYQAESYAVLGPDILSSATGVHQSPTRVTPLSLAQAMELKDKVKEKSRRGLYRFITWNLKLKLHLVQEPVQTDSCYGQPLSGCVLHGACYIFSPDFISARPYAFNPATFLYFEEDILQYECQRDGLAIKYDPSLKVAHLEDASTKAAFRSSYRRERMKLRYLLESLDIFIHLIDDGR